MRSNPRFLCDEMLGHVCRYLRAAGYDTLLARDGASDAQLLRQCIAEGRQFLTQDVLISEHKAARGVALVLPQGGLDTLAAFLAQHYSLDWLRSSFTRCLLDNTLLVAADDVAADDVACMRVPPDVLESGLPLLQCPACRRVYWQGAHFKRMHSRLAAWQAAANYG